MYGYPGLSPQVRGSLIRAPPFCFDGGSIPAGAGKPISATRISATPTVYPRRCGEAPPCRCRRKTPVGLSPQVRGSLAGGAIHRLFHGSIPAGAGKPVRLGDRLHRQRVYPRRCGEASLLAVLNHQSLGLSPQVRGSHEGVDGWCLKEGSIPAGAGKPKSASSRFAPRRVYPRRCGEARYTLSRSSNGGGLSPQVRGSPPPLRRGAGWRGSIPAGAGKPTTRPSLRTTQRVYPRRCGEALGNASLPAPIQGLSPQVRGSPPPLRRGAGWRGSIPAGAGKPASRSGSLRASRVYPRRCGEAKSGGTKRQVARGLSPQVRGSRASFPAFAVARRSIPAGAGKPGGHVLAETLMRVYPPRCGEADLGSPLAIRGWGLSPQVRGSREQRERKGRGSGSIPAGAGKPLPA